MQVIASVLRNLSWRADVNSKKTLREVGSVKALMECALEVKSQDMLEDYVEGVRGKGVKNRIRLKCTGEACFFEGDVGLD